MNEIRRRRRAETPLDLAPPGTPLHVAVAPGLPEQKHVVIRENDDTDEDYEAKQRLLDAVLAYARKQGDLASFSGRRPRLGPQFQSQLGSFLHLRDARRRRGGNSQPYCLYSSSKNPAPMPGVSRLRLIRSTLAAISARCAGLR
jgi:hypothetical protein